MFRDRLFLFVMSVLYCSVLGVSEPAMESDKAAIFERRRNVPGLISILGHFLYLLKACSKSHIGVGEIRTCQVTCRVISGLEM